jgi:hypothetical protein
LVKVEIWFGEAVVVARLGIEDHGLGELVIHGGFGHVKDWVI